MSHDSRRHSGAILRHILLRLGTRGSPLALAQARMVREALAAAHGLDPGRIALEVIRTSGDRIQDRPLAEVGGKGLFTKEIEEALPPARSISPCIRRRTCRRCCRRAWCCRRFCRARTRATSSSAARPNPSPNCRAARRSAPRRCAGRRW